MSPKIAVSDFSEIKGKFLHFLQVIVIAPKKHTSLWHSGNDCIVWTEAVAENSQKRQQQQQRQGGLTFYNRTDVRLHSK